MQDFTYCNAHQNPAAMLTPNLVYSPMAEPVARALISAECYRIRLSPDLTAFYQWKSGIKAPVYCNCRDLGKAPGESGIIARALAEAVSIDFPEAEAVIGLADAGIRWSSIVGHMLGVPDAYVRKTAKKHGTQPGRLVECSPAEGSTVVVIDDLVASGDSVLRSIDTLEEERGLEVLGVYSIVNWDFFEMRENFRKRRMAVRALVSYPQLLDVAHKEDLISVRLAEELKRFYRNPRAHTWDFSAFGSGSDVSNGARGIA